MTEPMWQELTKLLGVVAIPVAALIGAIAWVTKNLLTHALSKDITNLKSESIKEIEQIKIQSTREIEQMKIQSTREIEQMKIKLLQESELSKNQLAIKFTEEIEQLKSKLSILMKEHEIKFIGLHKERVDVIKNLRSKILGAYWSSMHLSNKISLALDSKLPFIEEREGKVSDNELVERLREPFKETWEKTGEASEYALDSSIYFSRDLYMKIHEFIEMLNHDCWVFIFSPNEPEHIIEVYERERENFTDMHNKRDSLLAVIEDEFRVLFGVDNTTDSAEEEGDTAKPRQ